MASIEALITPSVMRWARENAQYDIRLASLKIGRPEEDIIAWENGKKLPTLAQARKASKVYDRPLAFFYLPNPPEPEQKLEDYRKTDYGWHKSYSHELASLIQRLRWQQQWLREYLIEQGETPLYFIGSESINTPITKLANKIRSSLGVSYEEQSSKKDSRDALNYWIEKAENIRIYISREGKIDPEEARGIALSDQYDPFIYINAKDSYASRQFTLAHELVHLWLGKSGISNIIEIESKNRTIQENIEAFCNKTASLILIPEEALLQQWEERDKSYSIQLQVDFVAKKFNVSHESIARRLLNKSIINESDYMQIREEYIQLWRKSQEHRSGGGNYYKNQIYKNGIRFTRSVLEARYSGSISILEACRLLNVKVNALDKFVHMSGLFENRLK
jgi:Zn-dependent peptidase ImmA (M78 family)